MRHGVLAVALAAAAALAGAAGANGRPPISNGVFFRDGDPHGVYVRTTFGLLISRDAGCSFRWVCEQAIGYGGQFDPKYAIAASDGTIFATTFTGLRVSRDGGCTWTTATAEQPVGSKHRIAGLWVDAIDLAPNGDVWVATAESGKPNDVYRSTDNGRTFAPRNRWSPTIWWKSVKVAPTNARRVYIAGYQVAGPPLPGGAVQPPAAHVLRSDDAGERWTESPLRGVALGPTPIALVAAVDPANADTVFLIAFRAHPPAGDRLYRSTDGGATWTEVLAASAPILGVVHRGGAVYAATISGGHVSRDGGATFAELEGEPQLGCLGAQGDALVACGANWEPDQMAVARSADGGATWQKVLRFGELAGPRACAPGTTVHERCGPVWPGLQRQLGAQPPASCPAPVEVPAASAPPEPAAEAAPPAATQRRGGCCEAGGAGGPLGAAAGIAWLGWLSARRRRGPG